MELVKEIKFKTQGQKNRWGFNDEILKTFPHSLTMLELTKSYNNVEMRDAPKINFMGITIRDYKNDCRILKKYKDPESKIIPKFGGMNCPFVPTRSISQTHFICFNPEKKEWMMIVFYSISMRLYGQIKQIHPLYELMKDEDFEFIKKDKDKLQPIDNPKFKGRAKDEFESLISHPKNSPFLSSYCYIKRKI